VQPRCRVLATCRTCRCSTISNSSHAFNPTSTSIHVIPISPPALSPVISTTITADQPPPSLPPPYPTPSPTHTPHTRVFDP
jgi:hypothetical protein